MSSHRDPAEQQRQSWSANARAWTEAVRSRQIESRRVATDAAILGAVLARSPARVLDLGCGEGWLCRALAQHGIETLGIDASPTLIDAARAQGGGEFLVRSFAEVAAAPEQFAARFDAVVCNFSLLEENLTPLLLSIPALLAPGGALLIQTVHPWSACGDQPYRSGWRTESFQGFGAAFQEPMPWYFRTLSDWLEQLTRAGLQLLEMHEPVHPETQEPLSLLMRCTPGGA